MSGDRTNTPVGRKKWNRFNASTPVQNLDGCLAEDGCPDSQAVLGKQLLEGKLGIEYIQQTKRIIDANSMRDYRLHQELVLETARFHTSLSDEYNIIKDDSVDQEQNDRLGVYWLIKASEQGHKEATKILETCLKSGKGITKHNIGDVTTCLNMSQEEKISRHAARVLFTSLSQGTDYITSEQLSDAMERAQGNECRSRGKNSVQKAQGSIDYKDCLSHSVLPSCEKLSEDMLVSAASHHSKGELPIVHKVLALKKSRRRADRTFLQNSIFTPIGSIYASYQNFIHSIGKRPISSFFPSNTTCIQTLIILGLYSIGLDSIVEALPSLFYFSSLAIMLITTCQILTKKWEFNEFRQWSNLLVTWGGQEVNADGAEMSHCQNNIYPCYIFLLALVANIALSQFVSVMIIPYSELVVLSTICAFATLYNFAWQNGKFDFLALLSFGISALARYNPYDAEAVLSQSLRFLNTFMPSFVNTMLRDFNFSILMYVLMFVLLWRMAIRDQRKGIYKAFLPHLISLSWWQMAIIASNGATTFGLLRSSLVVVVAVLILPLAGLAILLLPIVAVVKFFIVADEALFESTTLAMACLCNLALMYFGTRPSRTGKIVGKLQVALGLVSALFLIFSAFAHSPIEEYNASTPLSWKHYQDMCVKDDSIQVPSQIKCASLSGVQVHWEGQVQQTKITNSYNPLANLVSKLPNWMQTIVTCMYGQKYTDECKDINECPLPIELHSKCHLSNWNRYEFEIEVKMTSGGTWDARASKVFLRGAHAFSNFTQGLSSGDKVWFSGALEFKPGSEWDPRLNLHQIGCLACSKLLSPYVVEYPQLNVYTLLNVFRHLVQFIFNPNFSF